MNGDGYADIVIGDLQANYGASACYVVYGGSSISSTIDLTNIGTQGFSITSTGIGYLGESVSNAGDVNGDGFSDVIVVGLNQNLQAYFCYVIYGGGSLPSTISLASFSSSQGISIVGVQNSVNGAGDINGDGYDDIIVLTNDNSNNIYIIYGSSSLPSPITLTSLSSSQSIFISGSGSSVNGAGDINADGYEDIIIGYIFDNSNAGKSYVIYGSASLPSTITLSNLGTLGFSISGAYSGDLSGSSVMSAGDVNGDNYADIIIEAKGSNSNTGTSYVIYGASISPTVLPTFKPTSPTVKPTALPTFEPTVLPTSKPTVLPTVKPTALPITEPTALPTVKPTSPTVKPTVSPTFEPTVSPTLSTIYITNGGTYTGTTESENFVINSPLSVTITGGGGIDTFKVFSNNDVTFTITDFNPINERIDLTSFTDIYKKADLNITKGSVIITLPNSQIIKLLSLSPSDIASGNFIFSTIPPTTTPTIAPTLAPTITTSQDKGISSELSIGAIVGIAVGGTALLIAGGYIMYTKLFSIGSSSQTVGTIPEILEKGTTLDQYPSASNYELVAIEPSAPPHIPIAYAVGDTQLQVIEVGHVEYDL